VTTSDWLNEDFSANDAAQSVGHLSWIHQHFIGDSHGSKSMAANEDFVGRVVARCFSVRFWWRDVSCDDLIPKVSWSHPSQTKNAILLRANEGP